MHVLDRSTVVQPLYHLLFCFQKGRFLTSLLLTSRTSPQNKLIGAEQERRREVLEANEASKSSEFFFEASSDGYQSIFRARISKFKIFSEIHFGTWTLNLNSLVSYPYLKDNDMESR